MVPRTRLFALITCLLVACAPTAEQVDSPQAAPAASETAATGSDRNDAPPVALGTTTAVVVAVADGDTITVLVDGTEHIIRLIGIDTPEVGHHGTEVECFGPEASAALKAMLPIGSPVVLTRDTELRDVYNRVLAYVSVPNTRTMVNAALLEAGLAVPLNIAPNLTHADTFAAISRQAREAGLGLWQACADPIT